MTDLAPLLKGLDALRSRIPAGIVESLAAEAGRITDTMRETKAHGDQTGATRHSYVAFAVGAGRDGSAEMASSVAAVQEFNPAHVGTGAVEVAGVGVVITSATDYQDKLETENGAEKAVLAPTLQQESPALTAAAARGSRKVLG